MAEDAPWLDEAEAEEEGPTHTLIGRGTLLGLLFLLGVLVVGVVVGIGLVSRREAAPIDVPAVGEEVPVLAAPGPWKLPPTGPDVDGVPVEGQGQVLFGTGDGQETEAEIALDGLPEDPLPRPGTADALPAVDEALEAETRTPAEATATRTPPAKARSADVVTPAAPPRAPVAPAPTAAAPSPATSGAGTTVQLGAFSSQARARAAFNSLTARYAYLQSLEPMIVAVSSDGKTLYRLRAVTGSPALARDICGRLRVAGEACSVVD
jgi:hypothetical protein